MKKAILITGVLLLGIILASPESALKILLKSYLALHQVEFRIVESSGYKIGFYEGGAENKKNVVLLHGIGGNAGSTWYNVLPELAKKYHVYAPDMIFADLNDLQEYDLQTDIELIEIMMRTENIHEASFVGLSVGAWLALDMAEINGPQVRSLVLVNPVVGSGAEQVLETIKSHGTESGQWFYDHMFYDAPPIPQWFLVSMFHDMTKFLEKVDIFFPKIIDGSQTELRLEEISQPTLIIIGQEDKIVPRKMGIGLAEHLPDARVVVLDKAGHAVVWDRPDMLVRHIFSFLETHQQ